MDTGAHVTRRGRGKSQRSLALIDAAYEILSLIDMDAWNHLIRIEAAERESMGGFLDAWHSSISGQATKYSPKAPPP